MKEKIINLVRDEISQFHVFVDDVYVSTEEGKDILNIVLDSPNTIDLKLITEASRVINKLIDDNQVLDDNIYEVDIYSKEKGDD
jgi:ribosome maturation factor RimP